MLYIDRAIMMAPTITNIESSALCISGLAFLTDCIVHMQLDLVEWKQDRAISAEVAQGILAHFLFPLVTLFLAEHFYKVILLQGACDLLDLFLQDPQSSLMLKVPGPDVSDTGASDSAPGAVT
jgi:hypothetical protein